MNKRQCPHSNYMPAAGFRAKAKATRELGELLVATKRALDEVAAARDIKELQTVLERVREKAVYTSRTLDSILQKDLIECPPTTGKD